MKTIPPSRVSRPWLMVVLAFVLLIFGWVITIRLSSTVPGHRLSADEEMSLLERNRAR